MDDLISRQAVQEMVDRIGGMYPYRQIGNRESYSQYNEAWTDAISRVDAELNSLPSAQPDAVTVSLEELINDYGEDGYFIVDGVNYQANELLNELKTNSSVGEKFRKQITKTIVQYFMKFGD